MSGEKTKERRVKNAENKKHSRCGHTGGRKSATMVEEDMIQKQADPTIPISRTAVWIETHTRKDRSILPSAVELMEKIEEKVEEAKNSENNSDIHPLSIDSDPLTQVLGKNSKGSLPGVCSHVSRRQYEDCLPCHIMILNERTERKITEKNFERLESKVDLCLNMCSKNISQTEAEAIVGSSPPQ
ncbi:uncharacterized protein M6B38_366675 [Iris pallida]|uniref:Uncharacterized protein n=1 Tax=Iris pallida TaxID=29817 RepID=A0AAX6GGV9_IRIPA|nr:uncharacterized protein M6B38_366675 [Iris pallida]